MKTTRLKIEIEEVQTCTAGACGGDQFGKDGLTEIRVNGEFGGLLHYSAGRHFSLEWGRNGFFDLGWRKNKRTAKAAAIKAVRKIVAAAIKPKHGARAKAATQIQYRAHHLRP